MLVRGGERRPPEAWLGLRPVRGSVASPAVSGIMGGN
jgi:hypothetical protein